MAIYDGIPSAPDDTETTPEGADVSNEYFRINDINFSSYVSELKIANNANYNIQTNAAGDSVVDYVNKKRIIEVTIIPLDSDKMAQLQEAISLFNVVISFRNPKTELLESGVNCIIPSSNVEYKTIRANKVMFKAFTLQFIEL